IAGMGMTDGVALMAVMGTIDAATRAAGRGSHRWWSTTLLWAAVGIGTRPMSAVLCVAVVVAAAVATVVRRPPAPPLRRVGAWGGGNLATLAGAMVITSISAAWYLRNLLLYGDPTGSAHLFAKFDRAPRSVGDFSWSDLQSVLDTLFLRRLQHELPTDPLGWSPVVVGVVGLGLVGAV